MSSNIYHKTPVWHTIVAKTHQNIHLAADSEARSGVIIPNTFPSYYHRRSRWLCSDSLHRHVFLPYILTQSHHHMFFLWYSLKQDYNTCVSCWHRPEWLQCVCFLLTSPRVTTIRVFPADIAQSDYNTCVSCWHHPEWLQYVCFLLTSPRVTTIRVFPADTAQSDYNTCVSCWHHPEWLQYVCFLLTSPRVTTIRVFPADIAQSDYGTWGFDTVTVSSAVRPVTSPCFGLLFQCHTNGHLVG